MSLLVLVNFERCLHGNFHHDSPGVSDCLRPILSLQGKRGEMRKHRIRSATVFPLTWVFPSQPRSAESEWWSKWGRTDRSCIFYCFSSVLTGYWLDELDLGSASGALEGLRGNSLSPLSNTFRLLSPFALQRRVKQNLTMKSSEEK